MSVDDINEQTLAQISKEAELQFLESEGYRSKWKKILRTDSDKEESVMTETAYLSVLFKKGDSICKNQREYNNKGYEMSDL